MPRFNPHKTFLGIFIPDGVMALDISTGAKFCYGLLLRFAGDHGYCWPKQSTIAEKLKVSDRQVRTYLAELEDRKLVESERVGLGDNNRYYFLDDWMSLKTEDRKETSDQSGSDTEAGRELPIQTGSILPLRQEENFRSFYKTEENQQKRESEERESLSLVPLPVESKAKTWQEQTFDVFWKTAVWAKIARGKALAMWVKKIKSPAQAQKAIDAAIRCGPLLVDEAKASGRGVLHPSTWLSDERFDDDASDVARNAQFANGQSKGHARLQQIAHAAMDLFREDQ